MKATILFLMDAFRWDYLDPTVTPFLSQSATEGHHYRRVIPSFGFCERAEILTGKTPRETGYFTAIGFDPERSPYRNLNPFLKGVEGSEKFVPITIYSRVVRRLLRMFVNSRPHGMAPYKIPYRFLPYFALTEDYFDHRDDRAFDCESVFDFLKQRGQTCFYDSFTALNLPFDGDDTMRLERALAAADQGHSLYLIYISSADAFGHKWGPHSTELRKELSQMDSKLKSFVHEFSLRRPGSSFVFLGDHGMTRVEKRIDVQNEVRLTAKKLGFQKGRDFLYFLDSTLCRIWFLRPEVEYSLSRALREHPVFQTSGSFVSQEIADREGVPFRDKRYGDLVWWTNPGVMISPDFFHLSDPPVKGMHGYDPGHDDSQGTCIVYGAHHPPMSTSSIPLTEVNQILRKCLL